MLGISSFILLIVVIAVIFYLVVKWTQPHKKRRSFSYVKQVQWMFAGYVVILLIGAVAVAFVPEQEVKVGKKVDSKVLQTEDSELHVAALEGKIATLDSNWKRKAWHFRYQGKTLNLVMPNNEYTDVLIVADRKATNDDQIEAGYYKTRIAITGREVTGPLTPIDVALAGNQLTIRQKKTTLTYSKFTNVFPVRQFTGESMFPDSSPFSEGQGILYLRIPKDLQLNHQENLNFEYVVK